MSSLSAFGGLLWTIVLFPSGAIACSCMSGHSACAEVTAGTAVFSARVLSVSPPFLNRLNPAFRAQRDRVLQFEEQLYSGPADQSLDALRETFRQLAPGLSPDETLRLKEASSRQAFLRFFEFVLDHGSYVTLEVKTVFSAGHDDDDDKPKSKAAPKAGTSKLKSKKDDDDDPKARGKAAIPKPAVQGARPKDDDDDDRIAPGKITAVWTPSFDCGVEFQVGETYLVYASMDEDTDIAETDTCMGTRRLSDAGADLPYLSFVKDNPKEAGRIDGFVTTDLAASANPPEGDRIPSPVAGALIELKSDDSVRYAASDDQGRFVFDGLRNGSYRIAAYTTEYPSPDHMVASPRELTIMPKTCARPVVLAHPPDPPK
jgi:hypothetical protein